MEDWYEDVYHASAFPKGSQEYWRRVRYYIIERDDFRCQACRKQGKYKDFTVHHIIPRIEGGEDDPENLITLHALCHDYVEAKGFKTRESIINCTKYLDKDEMQAAFLTGEDSAVAPIVEPKKAIDWKSYDEDRADIVCPCEIHHIRSKKEVGKSVKVIACICGLVGEYVNGEWVWGKALINRNDKIKPAKSRRKERKPSPPLEALGVSVQCPACLQFTTRLITSRKVITCKCGAQAIRRTDKKQDWMWFGYVPLYGDVHRRGV
jgi:hypothetical protein